MILPAQIRKNWRYPVFEILILIVLTGLPVRASDKGSQYGPESPDRGSLTTETNGTVQQGVIVRPPDEKKAAASSFPTLSFLLFNDSRNPVSVDFESMLPPEWSLVSFKKPAAIPAQSHVRVRFTMSIPASASPERYYRAGLVTRWEEGVDTSWVRVRIQPYRSIHLVTFTKDNHVLPGEETSHNYIFRNEGNVTDTLLLDVNLPPNWDLVGLSEQLVLSPREMREASLRYRTSQDVTPGTRTVVQVRVTVAAERKTWSSTELTDRLGLVPKEKEIVDLLFRSLDLARTEKQTVIRFSRSDPVDNRKDGIVAKTHVRVMKPESPGSSSLHPILPVQIGFAVNRIEKDRYPSTSLYIRSGQVDLGVCRGELELIQRASSVPVEEAYNPLTERVRLDLQSDAWRLAAGDVIMRTGPLQAYRSSLDHADLTPYDEIGRGLYTRLGDSTGSVTFFHGRRIFSDQRLTYAEANIPLGPALRLSPSFFSRSSSRIAALEGNLDIRAGLSLSALAGVSRSDSMRATAPAGQLRARLESDRFSIQGCLHWADPNFEGVDRGKNGAVLVSRWRPSPSLYVWSLLHSYRQSWLTTPGDSTARVLTLRTQTMIRLKGLPLVRFGVDLENKDLSGGFRIYRNNLSMQIQQYFRVGTPSVIVRYEDRTNPRYWIQEKVREVRLGFLSFIKRSRIRLEHQMIRYDEGLWGSVAHVETDVNILGQTIGFYLSTGKVWKRDYEGGFEETPVTSAGIRSNFMVRPFGKNYTMRLEVGRVMSELEDYQRSWRIALSLSAGTVPRFYVPVPFVKTKGRVEGVLFVDKNQNKIRDPDEQGLSHAVFLLKGESVITDSDGRFQSAPLEPGEYSFFLDMASLPAYVSPAGLIPANLSIHRGSIISLQIPLTSVCSFSGVLFLDLNRNERMDEDETPLGRVRLLVQNEQNQTWEVYTDLKGQFLASDLLPGTYRVKVDSSWLPDRTRVHRDETLVVLTPQQPHVETAIPVVKEQLEIRKTFIAPKKNP